MVAAAKNELLALTAVFVHEDGVGTVTTDIVECVNLPLSVLDEEEVEASHLKAKKASCLW